MLTLNQATSSPSPQPPPPQTSSPPRASPPSTSPLLTTPKEEPKESDADEERVEEEQEDEDEESRTSSIDKPRVVTTTDPSKLYSESTFAEICSFFNQFGTALGLRNSIAQLEKLFCTYENEKGAYFLQISRTTVAVTFVFSGSGSCQIAFNAYEKSFHQICAR